MTKEILNQFLKQSLESKYAELLKDKNYKEATKAYDEKIAKLKNYIPKDDQFRVLDELDIASANISGIEKEFYYTKGIQDGINVLSRILGKDIIEGLNQ